MSNVDKSDDDGAANGRKRRSINVVLGEMEIMA